MQNQSSSDPPSPDVGVGSAAAAPSQRSRWAGRVSFILAAVGYAVGLGNVWRFPYMTYKHGGAVFFVPYLLSLFLIGIPMALLELTAGQKL